MLPLWNYTLLPATVKVLETFLKAVLWKPFQLFRRILNISSITKEPSHQWWFQMRQQIKASWRQVRIMGDVPVLSHCSLLKKYLTITGRCAGALLRRRYQILDLQFLLTESLRRRKMSMYKFSSTVAIPVYSTNEFRELFDATMFYCRKTSRPYVLKISETKYKHYYKR